MKKTVGTKIDLDTIQLLEEKPKKEGKNKNQVSKDLINGYVSDNKESEVNHENTNKQQV